MAKNIKNRNLRDLFYLLIGFSLGGTFGMLMLG